MDIANSQIVQILSYHRFGVQTVFTHAISGHIYMKRQQNICMKTESKSPRKISVHQDGHHHQVHSFCSIKEANFGWSFSVTPGS